MPSICIANPQFEQELELISEKSLEESFLSNPLTPQLQFLSYLYAKPDDLCLTTHFADPEYKNRLVAMNIIPAQGALFKEPSLPNWKINYWGYTSSLVKYAQTKNLILPSLDPLLVKMINRKDFSFRLGKKLPGSNLLWSTQEVEDWMKTISGTKVLKSTLGLAGRGHAFINDHLDPRALSFLKRQWELQLPVLAEPWVERILDFSTQWDILPSQEVQYLGSTICQNDQKGMYQKTIILPKDHIPSYDHFLAEHKEFVFPILQEIAKKGFCGNLGIDAMIYTSKGSVFLHPIVEINGRKTMGFCALILQKTYFPNQALTMHYSNGLDSKSLLPHFLLNEKTPSQFFRKSLLLTFI